MVIMSQLMQVQVVFILHLDTGEDDYIVGQKYELPVISPLDDKGVFTEEGGQFEGMFYDKANKAVTDLFN